ncbi:Major Facilitator Superfamily protein [Seinonella peptonophila]|uniref:Major Facilitator Superfamily protein n=1 Tax=Seinonella peptonophila TaxID=112248 RepID=A0A1M4T5K5_9BACL|nr:MFS transporter [Seinonella peptonophila]SHE39685.1 Major Facilitator Superfamily protein [Seinonella peptonophila]
MKNKVLLAISKITNYHHLNRSAQLIILLHFFFCFAEGISSIFVSIYIWEIQHNLFDIASFYLYQSITFFLCVPIVGKLLKHQSSTFSIGIGALLLAIFYLLLLQNHSAHYIALMGLLQGSGYIFYWTGFHYLSVSLTKTSERSLFNSYNEISGALSSLISPAIAGGFIVLMPGKIGYIYIFSTSLLLYLTTTILSIFTKIPPSSTKHFALPLILKISLNPNKKWFWGMQMIFIHGFCEGIFLFLPSVIYFLYFHNEWNLGLLTSMLACLALLSNFLVGRFLPNANRNHAIFWGVFIHSLLTLSFAIYPTWITVLLFGLGISLAKPWYNVPQLTIVFDFIHQQPAKKEHYIEYLAAREISLGLGRMVSFVLLIALITQFHKAEESLSWYALILTFGLPYFWITALKFSRNQKKIFL